MKVHWFLIFTMACYQVFAQHPNLVWVDEDGGGRNEYAFFQKSIQIKDSLQSAVLHLYADSRYALYVNGAYVNFGPSRSYHDHPYYDTYDLEPLLHKGQNCLVVKVLSNGMETYQLFDYHGAFAAWGRIETTSENIDLSSLEWQCKASLGYDASMPRFSFATGAIESWDTSKDIGWNHCNDKDTTWQVPALLVSKKWGGFQPRPIPMLTQEEILAQRTGVPSALSNTEHLYSFRIPTHDRNIKEYNSSQKAIGYTYLFSEEEQEVPIGLWWGDYHLNGTPIQPDPSFPETNYRRNYLCTLKKGWNLFVVKYGIIWGSWEFYMALPKNARVLVSSERSKTDMGWFRTFLPVSPEDQGVYDSIDLSKTKQLIDSQFSESFTIHSKKETANHPVRDMVWKPPYPKKEIPMKPFDNNGIEFTVPTEGVALYYQMEETQLGRFFVEGTFPKGTIIDIGFSEEPHPQGGPWLYKRFQVAAGLRFIADGTTKRYESFKPYGAKYLQLNLYNAQDNIRIEKVGMVRQVYPFHTLGSFQSNDMLLNKIHEAGWRTLRLCAEDSYTDTPFRERGLYAGDMLPETAITMAMSGDMRLAAYSLGLFQDMYKDEMYAGKQNRHNDFPLITLLTADYLQKYLGGDQIIKKYYKNYAALLRHHLNRKNELGLIHANRVFIEWTDLNKEDAYMTAFQALLVKSLRTLSAWAIAMEKPSEADFFQKQADLLTDAINTYLWDANKGMYIDGVKQEKKVLSHHLTSSIWPAVFEVADSVRIESIMKNLKKELVDIGSITRKRKITPYSSFYLFSLLYQQGEIETAENFLKRYWSPMALHSETPTTWENFDIDGEQGTSSHAWSGHPTYFLATAALGVNLGWYQEMNSEVIEISPQSSYLEWAKGTVLHPSGPVTVDWVVKDDALYVRYKAPKGKKVIVAPKGRLGKLPLKVAAIEN